MPVTLNSSGGGSITLTAASTGSPFTSTLPAITDTIVTKTSTDTLTNKTLTSPAVSSGITLNGSGSGTTVLQPSSAASGTITLPAGTGTVAVNGVSSNIVAGTAVSASGTSITFTGIPSWAKSVTLILNGVSTSGTSIPIIQLGTSGGITTSGYTGAGIGSNATAIAGVVASSGFPMGGDNASTYIFSGHIRLMNISGNIWVASYNGGGTSSGGVRTFSGGGTVTLSAVLTQVRYTATNGTDTLTAGTLNIFYE